MQPMEGIQIHRLRCQRWPLANKGGGDNYTRKLEIPLLLNRLSLHTKCQGLANNTHFVRVANGGSRSFRAGGGDHNHAIIFEPFFVGSSAFQLSIAREDDFFQILVDHEMHHSFGNAVIAGGDSFIESFHTGLLVD